MVLDLDSPYALRPEQIQFYRDNGYIKLKQVLSAEVIEHYKKEIAAAVRKHDTNSTPMEKRSVYDQAFTQVHNLWLKSDAVAKFVMSKRLGRVAAELMGVQGVRLYHDQALYKEPGGGFTPWHVDQQYWPMSSNHCVTAWIPLQATPLEMGPLSFAPKSSQIRAGRDLEISAESEVAISRNLKDYPQDESAFDLGEVSFHSGWIFHRAGGNKTDHPREVMTIIYMDALMRLAEPRNKNQAQDREWWCPGVDVGAVINSRINPLIFCGSV